MPRSITNYRCLLISPGDVQAEREAIVAAVESWNAHVGEGLQARVEIVRWESHARPAMGAPAQEVINTQLVDGCDFGVAVFWSRLGSPTEKHPSGSAEEVERLLQKNAEVMVYFCERDIPQDRLQDDQYARLQALKKDYRSRGLLATYKNVEQLKETVVLHLTGLVTKLLTDRVAGPVIPSAGPAATLAAPRPDVRVKASGGFITQGHHTASALIIGVENHSTIAFFFSNVSFKLSNGRYLAVTADHQGPIMPQKIEPGDSRTLVFDPREWAPQLRGSTMNNVFIKDKIGREFECDPFQFQDALKSFWANVEATGK
jgi:hypothetical protein